MKIFFDCEFLGLYQCTELVSIGLVAENGRSFYAEVNDYDKAKVDDWLEKNVINKLLFRDIEYCIPKCPVTLCEDYQCKTTKKEVTKLLNAWLSQFEEIEWVSDVCHYDFVLLIDLLVECATRMPYEKWNSACHDINQDIASHYRISEIKAFDKNREEILGEHGIDVDIECKHNALYDAKVIRDIYNIIENRKNNSLRVQVSITETEKFKKLLAILQDERISEEVKMDYLEELERC